MDLSCCMRPCHALHDEVVLLFCIFYISSSMCNQSHIDNLEGELNPNKNQGLSLTSMCTKALFDTVMTQPSLLRFSSKGKGLQELI